MTTRSFAGLMLCASLLCAGSVLAAPKRQPPRKPPPSAAPAARPPPPPPANGSGTPAQRREQNDAASEAPANAARRGPTRVDFDDRLVQGQSTKQGAIYLFERKESALRSMLRKRDNFRREISDSVE